MGTPGEIFYIAIGWTFYDFINSICQLFLQLEKPSNELMRSISPGPEQTNKYYL